VTVGASDVPVECFTQASAGALKGPLGDTWTTRNFKQNPMSWSGADACKPLVVPFAFFVNNSVKDASGNIVGNITRDNAELIFSGSVYDWADLADSNGQPFAAKPVNVCLRHAGSGTHASIDAYLTSPLIVAQYVEGSTGTNFYFNDGSSDLMKCVNGSGSWTGAGAIGYADADQSLGSYTSTSRTALNGVAVSAAAIANGNYNFYGLQQLYGITATDPLCTFASDSGNITNPLWVSADDMVFQRTKPCEAFPLEYK
jgi:ABC-type phosphate transport system substrate-binding protein